MENDEDIDKRRKHLLFYLNLIRVHDPIIKGIWDVLNGNTFLKLIQELSPYWKYSIVFIYVPDEHKLHISITDYGYNHCYNLSIEGEYHIYNPRYVAEKIMENVDL